MNCSHQFKWAIRAFVLGLTVITFVRVGTYSLAQNEIGSGSPVTRVIGEVVAIDAAAGRVSLKTDEGQVVAIGVNEKTDYSRIPAGDKTMQRAVKISLSDIGVGDRVYARGSAGDAKAVLNARQLVAIARDDIQQKHERDRREWQQRGVAGIITAIDPQKQEIVLKVQAGQTVGSLIVAPTQQVRYRRYASDSIKFKDAKPASFAELQIGDQLRALGDQSPDGNRFVPEEIVSGAFCTVAGTVNTVNSETNQIEVTLRGGKQVVKILLQKESMIRRIPPEMAPLFIQPSQAEAKSGSSSQPAPSQAAQQNLLAAIESLAPVHPGEIKPGDTVMVFSTKGADPSQLTAITLVAGMEAVFSRLQPKRADNRGKAADPNTGMPAGVLEFAIGLP